MIKRIGRLVQEKFEKELVYATEKREMVSDFIELKEQLWAEQKKNKELELELKITSKLLDRHAWLSWHRETLRAVAQKASDDNGSDICVPGEQ